MRRFTQLFVVILTAFLWVACTGTEATTDDACAEVTCEDGESCVDGSCEAADASEPGDASDTVETDPETDDESDTPDETDPEPDPVPEVTGAPCETDADCDDSLFCEASECVAPRDEGCSPEIPCAEGFDCISTAAGATCLEPCEDTSTCRAPERCWATGEGSLLGELGGYCFPNLCGPPDNFGILKAAEFMGSCDSMGTGDGVCFGPVSETQLGPIGICMNASGALESGATCDSTELNANPDSLCDSGFCTPADICLAFCDVSDDQCEPFSDGTPTSCMPGSPMEGSSAGVCQPEVSEDTETEDEPAVD